MNNNEMIHRICEAYEAIHGKRDTIKSGDYEARPIVPHDFVSGFSAGFAAGVESSRKTASLSHCVTFPEDHSEHARGWNDCANRIESKLRALLPAKEERRDA